MKNTIVRHAGAFCVAVLCCTSAFSAIPEGSAPAMAASGAVTGARMQHHAKQVERRIAELHASMGITAAQEPLWDAFAQAMRDDANANREALGMRAQNQPTESADASMEGYADLARLHADNMQKLAAAFHPLYATFSDAQKARTDELFRTPGWRHVGKKTRGHASNAAQTSAMSPASTPAAATQAQ